MNNFLKPSYSVERQITKLKALGLNIEDETVATYYLNNISYFRLSAYSRPFFKPQSTKKEFIANTTFNDVLNLYVFDRELRLLILDAVERLEVALRAQISNILAENYRARGYLDKSVFNTRYNHDWLMKKLSKNDKDREKEAFLKHYYKKYGLAPEQPPIWMAVELLTFSEVSVILANLRHPKDKKPIEQHFGWKMPVLKSWFQTLSVLRNLCAHQNRIWNREFGVKPEIPKNTPPYWPDIPSCIPVGSEQYIFPNRRLYFQLVMIESLLRVASPNNRWAVRLVKLLDKNPKLSLTHMGFPELWDSEPFWNQAVQAARERSLE